VLEASNTCQQIPTGPDVLDFVMNEFTHDIGGGDTLGLGGHVKEIVPVQRNGCCRRTSRGCLSEYDNSMSWAA